MIPFAISPWFIALLISLPILLGIIVFALNRVSRHLGWYLLALFAVIVVLNVALLPGR